MQYVLRGAQNANRALAIHGVLRSAPHLYASSHFPDSISSNTNSLEAIILLMMITIEATTV